jgi:glycosyltransferase involved in cell wall biosynthesis
MFRRQNKKPRVLAFAHYYATKNRGGGEIMLHEILKQLVADGFDVDAVATTNEGKTEVMDGVTVYHGKEYRTIDLEPYDIIVTQFAESLYITPEAKKLKKKVVYIVHNTMQETNLYLHREHPDLAIFNTEWVKAFHKYNGNSIVVHPPVYAHKHATIPGNMVTLVNLTPPKGSNMFYNLALKLPKVQFLGVEGGYWKDIQRYLRRPNITFQDNTNNMKDDVWAKTKVLLVPSVYESYGMVAVEAMASGIPVIACPTPGLKESLDYAGIFPQTTSLRLWQQNLVKLLTDDKYYEERSKLALQRSKEIDPRPELSRMSYKVKELL